MGENSVSAEERITLVYWNSNPWKKPKIELHGSSLGSLSCVATDYFFYVLDTHVHFIVYCLTTIINLI